MPSSTRQCRACACDVRSRAPRELCRTLWRTPDAMPYATCIAARRRPVRLLRCAYRKRHAIRNDRQRVGRRTTRVSTSPARTPAAKLTPSAFATTMREPPPPPPSDIRSVCSASVTRYSPSRSAAPGLRATPCAWAAVVPTGSGADAMQHLDTSRWNRNVTGRSAATIAAFACECVVGFAPPA